MTASAAFDLGSFIEGSIPFAIIGLVTMVSASAFFSGLGWYSRKASYRELAQLYTHSSAFWARWPDDRIWVAPFDELAAEAHRCEELIRNVGGKVLYSGLQRGPAKKRTKERRAEFRLQIDREIATYQGMLATVRNAMNYAVAQGKGRQEPGRA